MAEFPGGYWANLVAKRRLMAVLELPMKCKNLRSRRILVILQF